jgi:acetylornithine deacetylase/succinyl-diaminopimelate desuccinylase-like protein
MPGTTPEAMLDRLKAATAKIEGIRLEILDTGTSNASPINDDLYRAIVHYAVEERPYAVAGPLLAVGYTDSLLLRPLGVNAYGYIPFELAPEIAETAHGHGERVPVDQVGEGLRRLFSIVVDVAGTPPPEGAPAPAPVPVPAPAPEPVPDPDVDVPDSVPVPEPAPAPAASPAPAPVP